MRPVLAGVVLFATWGVGLGLTPVDVGAAVVSCSGSAVFVFKSLVISVFVLAFASKTDSTVGSGVGEIASVGSGDGVASVTALPD